MVRAIKFICKIVYKLILKLHVSVEEINILKDPDYYFNFNTEDDLK